ncbi:MAG: ParB/RepB/Spo0J family partition protein [bacterium]|nr:ParB/RepB/Spo0J family partition protein [bacterium]
MSKDSRLGRGLAALLPEGADLGGRSPRFAEIEIDKISANPQQPRTHFDQEALADLAASIKVKGVVQPIIVRRVKDGLFELIAGERRLRAAKMAGLERIPVFIAEVGDGSEALELALIENLQREDLNSLEQADGFQRLAKEYGLTQEDISEKVGKSRAAVANTLRLLNLPRDVQASLRAGEITAGHARAILSFDDRERQVALWKKIIKEGLSVRKAEQAAKNLMSPSAAAETEIRRPTHLLQIEERLRNILGTHVRLHYKKGKGGSIEIEYYSDEDLERLIELMEGIG